MAHGHILSALPV